jgi:hypothetical protein
MATRYSWFLTSLGTPTFIDCSSFFVAEVLAPIGDRRVTLPEV